MPSSKDTNASSLQAEKIYAAKVREHLPRNYLAHLIHGLLGQTGFRLINAPTFMPAFIALISGGSSFVVGLCLSLQALGMVFSPLLGAHLVDHRKRVLPWGLAVGACIRLIVLAVALLALWLSTHQALLALYLCMLLLGIFMGMQGVIFTYLMAKVIPTSMRGKLTGLRNFLAGITTSVIAYLAGEYLIGEVPSSEGYGYVFLLAFALASVGLFFMMLIREPEPPETHAPMRLSQRLQEAFAILSEDLPFRRYVIARAIATMGRMAAPFYILYAGEDIGITGQTLGVLTLSFTFSGTVSNLVWGTIGDRTGFVPILLASLGLWMLSTLLLMNVSGLWSTSVAFIGIGAAFQGFQNASVNATLEFGQRQDLPMRIALANSTSELAGAIGPLFGGLLAVYFSYESVFWTSISFLAIGSLMLASLDNRKA